MRLLTEDEAEKLINPEVEFILCAAIDFNGAIVCGHRHSDCYETLQKLLPTLKDIELPGRNKQGFLTSLNRYVDRKDGYKIAKSNKQIKFGPTDSNSEEDQILISENLY